MKIPLKLITIKVKIFPRSHSYSIYKLTFKYISILIYDYSKTICFIIFPIPNVHFTVFFYHFSIPIKRAIIKLPFISNKGLVFKIDLSSVSMFFVIFIIALIQCSIKMHSLSKSILLAIFNHLPMINISIFESEGIIKWLDFINIIHLDSRSIKLIVFAVNF